MAMADIIVDPQDMVGDKIKWRYIFFSCVCVCVRTMRCFVYCGGSNQYC